MLNKVGWMALAGAVLLSTTSYAAFVGPGARNVDKVAAAKELSDDTEVSLEGHIVKELKHEHYLFKDDSGEIEVEIDDEDWRGQDVGPDTKIRIHGEVDQGFRSTSIEVERIEVLTTPESR